MKILQLVPELNVGGVERGTVDLARVLISKGHEAHVISAGGPLVGELEKIGARHIEMPIHKKSLKTLRYVKTLVQYIEEYGIDIVHARSRVPAWVGYLATRYTDADFITTCHGYYSKHFMSRVMGWGKRVIVISNVVGRRMIDDFGVPEERIRLIPRGIDLKYFPYSPLKERFPKTGENFKIINVGRITPLKGHKDFIKALHWVKQRGKDFEAWIVGSAPKKKQKYFLELERLVDRYGLKNHVKFLGTRYDVPELLKEAHLLVLSTTAPEAFGRVVAEAGACGTAVISTEVGGVVDIVRNESEGRLVPPHDPIRMAAAICEAMEDEEKTFQYADNLASRVREHFHLTQMFDKTLKVYEETMEEKRILVIKLGALGDIILISPSLKLLRKRFPKSKICLLVDERFYEAANHLPFVDEILVYHRKKSKGGLRRYIKMVQRLRSYRFDLSIDFQNIPKTHLAAYLAGIPRRLGFKRGPLGFLLTSGAVGHKKTLPPVPHQFQVLKGMGLGFGHQDESLELKTMPTTTARVDRLIKTDADQKEKRLLVGFALSASEKWVTKNWPLDSFVKLGQAILKEYPARLVLIGTSNEAKRASEFCGHFDPKDVWNLAGKTDMPEMLEVIRRLDLLAAPDSAPLHVASAFQTPVLGFFGPTDSKRHAPPGIKQTIFQKTVSCGPCYKRECPAKTFDCMKLITVRDVFSAAKKFLDEKLNDMKREEKTGSLLS